MDVPAELTHEVGVGKIKLPIGLWIVAGAVGIFIARKAKGFSLGGASTSTSTDATATDPNALAYTYANNGAVNVTPGGGFNSGASSAITTNEQWRVAAQNYLTAQRYDALAAANAIATYLANDDLSPVQAAMVEKALRYLGPTPEPVGEVHVIPTPTPTPKPKPPKPTPTPTPPVKINPNNFPRTIAANSGTSMVKVGVIQGGQYVGKNSSSGAPVYALVATGYGPNTSYTQGWSPSALPNGTGIYTLSQFGAYFG